MFGGQNAWSWLSLYSCTWEDFASLAVCTKCVNINSSIKTCSDLNCDYYYSLPNGPTLSGPGSLINSSVTRISSHLEDIEPSIIQFSALISKTHDGSNVVSASECSMYYCVNRYSTHVTDGEIEQMILNSWRNDSATYSQPSDLLFKPPGSGNTTFWVAKLAAQAMNSFMSKTFTGNGSTDNSSSSPAFSSDVIHALYEATNYSRRIENLAISMTNNIRQQNDSGSTPFSGLAFRTESYVKVRWGWFAYPAALIVLALLYFLSIIIESTYREVSIWKSSTMANLFHGHGMMMVNPLSVPVTTLSEMSKLYKDIKVELLWVEGEGWKFVQKE